MEGHGFTVQVEDAQDFAAIKNQYHVPANLQSCHTAIVDGYIVEGHVPVEDVNRLLAERPDILGLAVPGMPVGSPGMDGANPQPFDVISFDAEGNLEVFASYNQ